MAHFYGVNGAAIVPEVGDVIADNKARTILLDRFSDRDIVQLNADTIAASGSTHDITQWEFRI
jgi:agmatine/peptidylarginine deiminase